MKFNKMKAYADILRKGEKVFHTLGTKCEEDLDENSSSRL